MSAPKLLPSDLRQLMNVFYAAHRAIDKAIDMYVAGGSSFDASDITAAGLEQADMDAMISTVQALKTTLDSNKNTVSAYMTDRDLV